MRRRLLRFAPPPRLLDWSLGASVAIVLGTGLYSLLVGHPSGAWVFDVHAVAAVALVVLLPFKLARVVPRVRPDRLTGPRLLSVLLATTTVAALATGVWWVFGGALALGPWGLLNLHIGLGLVAPALLLWHLRHRFHSPTDVIHEGRRSALQYAAVAGVSALAWRSQRAVNDLLDTAGADRRFTGSREEGSDDGNAFPTTSWVADDPDPIDPADWTLDVVGHVAEPHSLSLADLEPDGRDPEGAGDPASDGDDAGGTEAGSTAVDAAGERRAVLDCTSGWYSEHDWQGVAVGDLLDAVDPDDGTRWVQFRSVTGYRWSLPIEEARGALLATRVDGDPLSHGHGAPMRLVAPDRRGFQWVKWVVEVRVSRRRDPGERVAIFVSGL